MRKQRLKEALTDGGKQDKLLRNSPIGRLRHIRGSGCQGGGGKRRVNIWGGNPGSATQVVTAVLGRRARGEGGAGVGDGGGDRDVP